MRSAFPVGVPITRSRDMDFERPPDLRTADSSADETSAPGSDPRPAPFQVNAVAELVYDLLAATGLVPEDKLALIRGRAAQGSFAEAILAEGVASSEGIARTLAARHHVPLVDLALDAGISDAPLVRLVNSIIFQAAEDGASDVHFEPQEDALVVRLRIDGVLHEVQRIPKRMTPGVTTRLKVLAKLDIAERRKPQDGRISLNAAAAGRMLDVRVATLPTVEGETVVMRLLDKSKKAPTLEELGLSDAMRAQLSALVTRPTGALLVTGPTGSGKSTTLYAVLEQINRPEINIITVEDPVEYRLAGVNQVQNNQRAALTFAATVRP